MQSYYDTIDKGGVYIVNAENGRISGFYPDELSANDALFEFSITGVPHIIILEKLEGKEQQYYSITTEKMYRQLEDAINDTTVFLMSGRQR
jgi:hypothetical protein